MLKVGVSCWRAQTVLLHLRSDDEDREVDFLHKVSESSLLHDLAEPRLHHNEKHVDKKRDEQANQPKTKHKNRQTRQTANKDGDHRCKQSPPPKKKREERGQRKNDNQTDTTSKRKKQQHVSGSVFVALGERAVRRAKPSQHISAPIQSKSAPAAQGTVSELY